MFLFSFMITPGAASVPVMSASQIHPAEEIKNEEKIREKEGEHHRWMESIPVFGMLGKKKHIKNTATSILRLRLLCLPAGSYLKIKVSRLLLDCFSVPLAAGLQGQSAHVFVGCIL